MLQQALSQNLVSLTLHTVVNNDEWASICGLTALTQLHIRTPSYLPAQVIA